MAIIDRLLMEMNEKAQRIGESWRIWINIKAKNEMRVPELLIIKPWVS